MSHYSHSIWCLARFNSLREENEGFSKMLVCLQSFGAAAAESAENIAQIVSMPLHPVATILFTWLVTVQVSNI